MNHVDNTEQSPVIISLCTGLRALERGLDRALGCNATVAAFVEVETFIIENLLAAMEAGVVAPAPIWANLKTFPFAAFYGKVHGIIGGYPCFEAGTRILTSNGNKAIEELSTDDFVLSHKGEWRRVTSIMRRDNANTRIISGHGVIPTVVTEEHPYYGRHQFKKWHNDIRQYRFDKSEPEWIEAKDIIPNEGGTILSQVLPKTNDIDQHSKGFWWVMGRYVADGWSQWSPSRRHKKGGRITVCCNRLESEFLSEKIKEAGFNAYRNSERTTDRFTITEHWVYEFVQQFGRGASDKHLSRTVFELSTEKATSFIEGYLTGDGCRFENSKGGKGWEATTISESLALDIALLSQRTHGVVASIKRNKLPNKCTIEGRVVNQKDSYQVRIPDKNRSAFIEGDYGWKLAKSNKNGPISTVYNISVEIDESYVANGAIVHNCQPFSLAGQRKGVDDPRHLWPFISAGIRAVRPVWCFFENVDDHITMGFDVVYKDLRSLGYLVEIGIYSAEEVGAPHERQRLYIFAIRQEMAYTNEYDPGRIIGNVLRTKRESPGEKDQRQRDRDDALYSGEAVANAGSIRIREGGSEQQPELIEQDGVSRRDDSNERWPRGHSKSIGQPRHTTGPGSTGEAHAGPEQRSGAIGANPKVTRWPAGQWAFQYDWEEPRTIEPLLVDNVDGGQYKRDNIFINNYGQEKERAIEKLLELWDSINSEDVQWDIGRLSAVLKEKILFQDLLSRLTPQKLIFGIKQQNTCSQIGGSEVHPLRYRGKLTSTSCGQEPLKQLAREFEDALWIMSYQIALERGQAETSPKLYDRMLSMWDVYKNTRWDVSAALSKVQEVWQPEFDESKHARLWLAACREYVMENNRFVHVGDLHRAIGNSVVEQTAEIAFIDLIHKHIKSVNYGR